MDKIKGLFGGDDAKDAAQDAVEGAQQSVNPAVAGAQEAAQGAQGAAQQAAADNPLAGLFGGGEQRAEAEDFVNRVTTGKLDEGYSNEEALAQFQKVASNASPEQLQRAAQEAYNGLDDNQRAEFAQMLQERAGGVDRSGTAAMAGGAAAGAAGGGGFGDILGSLTGGGSGGSGGADFGSMISQMMGGGGGGASTGATQGGGSGGGTDIMDMLGGFMSSTAGKAVIGGIAAFATKELLDKK